MFVSVASPTLPRRVSTRDSSRRAAGLRAVRAFFLLIEARLCRSKSRVGPLGDISQTVFAQRSVVVGCFGIPSDRCRMVQYGRVSACLSFSATRERRRAVFPARSHGVGLCHVFLSEAVACVVSVFRSQSCPEIKQGYPLNLSI